MNNILAVFTPAQTTICILIAVLVVVLIATNFVMFFIFHKPGERKLYDRLLQQERELLIQQLKNMNTGEAVNKEHVDGVIDSVQNSDRYAASEEKTISDLRNVITLAAEKFEIVTKTSVSESVAAAATPAPVPEPEPEEPVAVSEPEPELESEDEEEQADLNLTLSEDEEEVDVFVTATGQIMRYNRSFTARVIQGGDLLQARYNELKNYLLSFRKVKGRISWKRESFRFGRSTVATFVVRGKTLCLCLALDPKRFDETKYKLKDLSVRSPKSPTPSLYQIRNSRRVGYAKELIDLMMSELGTSAVDNYAPTDFLMPYETTEALIEKELIKVVGEGGTPFAGVPATEESVQEVPAEAEESAEESAEEIAVEAAEESAQEEPAEAEETPAEESAEESAEEVIAKTAEEPVQEEKVEEERNAEAVTVEPNRDERYNYSFMASVCLGDDQLRGSYSELKNYLLSYRGIKNKIDWEMEEFRKGRVSLATFVVRDNMLCLCLKDDPARYAGTKYKVEDLSLQSKKTKTPLFYAIKNDRRVKYAKELIDAAFTALGLEKEEHESVPWMERHVEFDELIDRGLVRVIEDESTNG